MNDMLRTATSLLRPVPDFPKPGILFWDIAPLLRHHQAFTHVVNLIADYWRDQNIQVVGGFDARGFIFGVPVAQALGVGFEQLRKKGKLPGPTKSMSYDLEYGSAEIEMIDDGHLNGARVLLIDDLLATGGTARAGVDLARELGATVVGISFFTELPHLGGRAKLLDVPVHSLVSVIEDEPLIGVEYCIDTLATDQVTGELLLVERLDGLGIAMPGGRIEAHESIIDAAHRELSEEANCPVLDAEYLGTLVGSGRDPRGLKVSTVLRVDTNTKEAVGETGKTEIRQVMYPSDLPPAASFAFDHGPFVHKHWREPSLAFV